jgi:O-antigen/teichoic acid export membrane protein
VSVATATSGESLGQAKPDFSRLAKGGLFNLAGLSASALFQFLVVIIVARGLGATGTGAFFEAVALFTIFSNVGELGADAGLVRTVPRYRALGRTRDIRSTLTIALVPIIILGLIMGAAIFYFAPQLSTIFMHGIRRSEGASYIRALALFLPAASACTVVLSGTRGFGTMLPYVSVQNIGVQGGRCLLVFVAVAAGLKGRWIALGWIAPQVMGFVAAVILLILLLKSAEHSDVPEVGEPRSRRQLASEFWRFSAARGVAAVFGITIGWLDVLLVGALRSTASAGVYATVSRFSLIGALILDAVGMAVAPQIAGLIAGKRSEDAESVYQLSTWWLIGLTWPFYITLALFGPLLLRIFGGGFSRGSTALLILALAQLVNLGTGNVLIVLLMAGKSSWNLINSAVSVGLNIGLNLFLIPRWGINGAAIAWAVSILCTNLAALLEVRFLLGLRPFGRGYLVVAGAAALCFGIIGILIRGTLGTSLGSLVLYGIAASVAYAFLLWRWRVLLQLPALWNALPRLRFRSAG